MERERPSSSPSEEFVEVWFDSAVARVGVAVEGSAREGVALASVLLMVLVAIVDAIVGSWIQMRIVALRGKRYQSLKAKSAAILGNSPLYLDT